MIVFYFLQFSFASFEDRKQATSSFNWKYNNFVTREKFLQGSLDVDIQLDRHTEKHHINKA